MDLWDEKLRLYLIHPDGFELWNLRVALDILVDDISKRHPQSKSIRAVLGDSMRLAVKTHPILRTGYLKNEIDLLASDFEKRERLLARNRARAVAHQMDALPYSESLVDALAGILEKPGALTRQQGSDLEAITRDIIERLIRIGFSVDAISTIPRRLFAGVVGEGELATTIFPKHYLNLREGTNEPRSWVPLSEPERLAVEALTLRQRIATLAKYMHASPRTFTCIFGIEGLTGTAQFAIGSVVFYSPATERFLRGGGDTELMGQDSSLNPVNAKIEIDALDGTSAREKARATLEHALNIMSLAGAPPPALTIRNDRWAIVDQWDPSLYGFTEPHALTSTNLAFLTKSLNDLAISVEALHAPTNLIGGNFDRSGLVHELSTSLHWLRRAQEATRPEDRLLFHWLAFEKLFDDPTRHEPTIAEANSTFDVIEYVYPMLDAYIDVRSVGRMIRNYIGSFWKLGMNSGFQPRFGPDAYQTLVNRIGEDGDAELLRRLRKVNSGNSPERFVGQIARHIAIIDDPKSAAAFFKELMDRSRRQLRITYWLRNRLVHGGDFGFPALAYYSTLLDYGTRALLSIATDTRNWRDEPRHPVEILISFYGDAAGVLRELSTEPGTLEACLRVRPIAHPY